MVRTLVAAVAALAIQTASVSAKPVPKSAPRAMVPLPKPRPNIIVAQTPRLCLARLVYAEARNQPYLGKLLVGYTVKRRTEMGRRDFGDGSYCGVAHAKTRHGEQQYSGMTDDPVFIADDKEGWQQSLKAADHVLEGYRPLYEWAEAAYFINPQTAGLKGKCWFERRLIELGWFQDHLFYREPRDRLERMLLKLREPSPECAARQQIASR